MKLYLVLLLAILSTAFAGKQRSQKCKDNSGRSKNVRGLIDNPFVVEPPTVSGWGRITVTLNTVNGTTTRSQRTVAIEASNCEFRNSPSATLNSTEVDGSNIVEVGTEVNTITFDRSGDPTRNATNLIRITSSGGGCAALCYLVSDCTHYNFGDNLCTLFSSKSRVTHFSAVINRRGTRKCGLKAASTTANNPSVFTQNTPDAVGSFRRGNDCMFTEQPFARERNANNESECAQTCNNFGNQCNAYEFFANDRTCIYKKTSRRDDAFISSAGFQTGSTTNRNLRCGAKN